MSRHIAICLVIDGRVLETVFDKLVLIFFESSFRGPHNFCMWESDIRSTSDDDSYVELLNVRMRKQNSTQDNVVIDARAGHYHSLSWNHFEEPCAAAFEGSLDALLELAGMHVCACIDVIVSFTRRLDSKEKELDDVHLK